ncbi:probable tRNA modification GTPase MnmE [Coccomyxa sp. Obi]|nr:probable tRNA modification GTPase MnmE [Coccomyxa sp. Obi]
MFARILACKSRQSGLLGQAQAQAPSEGTRPGASTLLGGAPQSSDTAPSISYHEDTIAAIVTGPQGAVSIVRLSGPEAVQIAQQIFQPSGNRRDHEWQPRSHRVYHGLLLNSERHAIDEVLVLAMLAPRSYTREDVIELHTHGGGVCAARALQACLAAGARRARPGEFTLRAFLNGRLDLSQAEAVAALVNARTAEAADSALAGMTGGLGAAVAAMRSDTLNLLAELEARIDFDEDLPPLDAQLLRQRLAELKDRVTSALDTSQRGRLLSTGLQVALVGRPNVGKSSLLNALSGSERAIVTDIPGTTRDIVEAGAVMQGIPVNLLDTAGVREAGDLVERLGVQRSRAAAQAADIVLMIYDATLGWTEEDSIVFEGLWSTQAPSEAQSESMGPDGMTHASTGSDSMSGVSDSASTSGLPSNGAVGNSLEEEKQRSLAHRAREPSGGAQRKAPPLILVANKLDLANGEEYPQGGLPDEVRRACRAFVSTSAASGDGLDDLRAAVVDAAGLPSLSTGGRGWAVNERQAEALLKAREALDRAAQSMTEGLPVDFWTIDVKDALLALGEVTGTDASEDVLDRVFSTFCIGK